MNKSSAKKFGENMKRIRLEKGMSQGDICRGLDLYRSYISNVENGKQNLTLSTMEKTAKVFGASVSFMLESMHDSKDHPKLMVRQRSG